MKRFFILGLVLSIFAAVPLRAQVPQTMSYQGVLSAANGDPFQDGTVSMTFKLYDATSQGNLLWEETQDITVTSGLFNAIMGSVIPLTLPFDKKYWLGLAIDNGTELSPRIELTSSSYSLSARSVSDDAIVAGTNIKVDRQGNSLVISTSDTARTALLLPFFGDVNTEGDAISVTNNGKGRVALFENTNPDTTTDPTVEIRTNGGPALTVVDTRDGPSTNSGAASLAKMAGLSPYHTVNILTDGRGALSIGPRGAAQTYEQDVPFFDVRRDVFNGPVVRAVLGSRDDVGVVIPDPTDFGLTDPDFAFQFINLSSHYFGLSAANLNTLNPNPAGLFFSQGWLAMAAVNNGMGAAGWFKNQSDDKPTLGIQNEGIAAGLQLTNSWLNFDFDANLPLGVDTDIKIQSDVPTTGMDIFGGRNGVVVSVNSDGNALSAWQFTEMGYSLFAHGHALIQGRVEADEFATRQATTKIDHPTDPANKFLNHAMVTSSEMMNVYNGNIILDANGEAWVELPQWFETLNKDFRYQLTCVGGFAQVYIAEKIQGNRFKVAGGNPGLEVSWQVTGVRQDPYALANPIQVEQMKPANEIGTYLNPDLYGQSEDRAAYLSRSPEIRQQYERIKEQKLTKAKK